VTPATSAASSSSSSSPFPFRRLPDLVPSRVLSPRLLSTSGRDDDRNKPWNFAADSGDPDPFANEDAAAAGAVEGPTVRSTRAADEPWAAGFGGEDGDNGDVFEGIYKEAASAAPARGVAAPAGNDEQWTLSGDDEEKDPFAAAVLGEGIEGIQSEGAGLDDLDAGEDPDDELKRQQNKAREKELMEILKGDYLQLILCNFVLISLWCDDQNWEDDLVVFMCDVLISWLDKTDQVQHFEVTES
jgi:small subunit ribosomal protein S9